VGNDARGARLAAQLAATAVRSVVRQLVGVSACQQIRMGVGGERIFCGFEAGVLPSYELTADELSMLHEHDAIALPCSPESRRVFKQCIAAGLGQRLVADFSQDSPDGHPQQPATWLAPHVNELALAFVGGAPEHLAPLRALSEHSPTPIVLTVGARGAYALSRGVVIHQPTLATAIVDTTGCGDAFQAAFTVSYLVHRDLGAALEAGAQLAARVASHRGASP
jgi:fructoselysine 6-kinase